MISQQDRAFSKLALKNAFMSREQVKEILRQLKREKNSGENAPRFDDLAVERGFMSNEQAAAVSLAYQRFKKDLEKKKWAIPGYEMYSKIGQGGLGVVFKAKQLSMNRLVALKILHRRWLNDREFKQRFLVEARLVGKLSHQNLIKVYDVGQHDWKLYFSMEFVEGENLEEVIEREGPLSVLRATDYTIQTVRAINYIKQYDVVHCDIKPSNVMLTPNGTAKLGDFGFVRSNIEIEVQEEGSVLGTPDYISPEQAMGEKTIDFRSDLYSLGMTMYHMLAKTPPFDGSVSTIMRKHIREKAPSIKLHNPDVPDDLIKIIDKLTAKNPSDRYQSCEDLFHDLEVIKIREKTGKDLELDGREIMTAIELEKDKTKDIQRELYDVKARLKKMTLFFWIATGLFGISVLVSAILLFVLATTEGAS